MAEIEWIKLSTDLFENRKIKQIMAETKGDTLIVIWLNLLVLAAESECGELCIAEGLPYTARSLATEIKRPEAVVKQALTIFKRYSMIDDIGGVLHIKNWQKYQNIAGMERVREKNRLRVAACRERKKSVTRDVTDDVMCNVTGNVTSNVTVTSRNAIEGEEEREGEKEREIEAVIGEEKPTADRLILYATDNLRRLTPDDLDELDSFRKQLSDEMIIWAIDETCGKGSRNYGYLKAILNRFIAQGLKTIGDVKAYEEKRRREKQQTEQTRRAKQAARPMDERQINPAEFEPDYSELMNRPRSSKSA